MKRFVEARTGGETVAGDGVLFLREQQIRLAQELMLLVWLDMGQAVSPVLTQFGLGVAQHRALQMLAFQPGLTVGELQGVLGVTKQSLARTLTELQERSLVRIEQGRQDRRQRFLFLTDDGAEIEAQLFAVQRERMVAAYREAGGNAVQGFRQVLQGMLSRDSRAFLARRERQTREAVRGARRDGQ
ncbi:MarR family transcriptional regulator [Acetobacter aceti]|uniref:MarR family transcriptional regulator n=1 Tax=Acetobacter aceti TaxID=435 RepID=A0A6S6PNG7_ACEAC|nr:MarR family transcriptional regulator [Acetobacter aceti]BCI68600.1 MarR family transcriptional regulator [Acetobacter aceti]